MHFTVRMVVLTGLVLLVLSPPASVLGQGSPQPQKSPPASRAPGEGPSGTAAKGTPANVVDNAELDGLLGKEVHSSASEKMGRIIDLLVDRSGQVRAVVIDFGGFLGVGSRKIVVDWSALHFAPAGKPPRITLEFTRDQVRLAPEYKQGEPVVVLGVPKAAPPPSPTKPPTAKK